MKYLKLKLSDEINAVYRQDNLDSNEFFLNKDFEIQSVKLDDKKIAIRKTNEHNFSKVTFEVEDYQDKTIEIIYKGVLDGRTGRYPYVREKTSDEFYILRSETVFFPIDLNPASYEWIERYINPQPSDEFTLEIQLRDKERIYCTNLKEVGGQANKFKGYNPTISVGKYQRKRYEFGEVNLFASASSESIREKSSHIDKTIQFTNEFMNRFYKDKIENFKVIEVRSGYGSFVLPNTMFIEEESILLTQNLVHELIHTNWNPKAEIKDQRSRFFDEGITQYFTYRVLENMRIGTKETIFASFEEDTKYFIDRYGQKLTGISQFGKNQLGDLSYAIGPIFLLKLEERIGREVFDDILCNMLEHYKEEEVSFEKFHRLFSTHHVDDIFEKYVYSSDWVSDYS